LNAGASAAERHELHVVLRHVHESVQRMERQLDIHFDPIGIRLQRCQRLALSEHAPPLAERGLGRKDQAAERRHDFNEVHGRFRHREAIIRVKAEMVGLDARMRDVQRLLDRTVVERQLNRADLDRHQRRHNRRRSSPHSR
jgi:hypothetical protein